MLLDLTSAGFSLSLKTVPLDAEAGAAADIVRFRLAATGKGRRGAGGFRGRKGEEKEVIEAKRARGVLSCLCNNLDHASPVKP